MTITIRAALWTSEQADASLAPLAEMQLDTPCVHTGIPYVLGMEDRFDPTKDVTNRERHGLPLMFGERLFGDPDHLIIPSIRRQDGEERYKVVGRVEGKVYTAVFTWRGDLPRHISVRRSNTGEERAYRSAG
jgi:uncharacterized protein